MSAVPRRVHSEFNPSAIRKDTLLVCLKKEPAVYKLFAKLAEMPAATRLSVNLRIISMLMSLGPVQDILRDGLTHVEKQALLRVEALVPEEFLQVAHGLLNVHERWLLVRALSKQFRQAVAADLAANPVVKPLDPILGKTEDA